MPRDGKGASTRVPCRHKRAQQQATRDHGEKDTDEQREEKRQGQDRPSLPHQRKCSLPPEDEINSSSRFRCMQTSGAHRHTDPVPFAGRADQELSLPLPKYQSTTSLHGQRLWCRGGSSLEKPPSDVQLLRGGLGTAHTAHHPGCPQIYGSAAPPVLLEQLTGTQGIPRSTQPHFTNNQGHKAAL